MSQIILTESAEPSTPDAGKAALYVDLLSRLVLKTDGGVLTYGGIFTTGSWNPTVLGSSTAGAHTYSVQSGRYVKIISLVIAWFSVTINAKDGAMAGDARIGGLPFAVRTGGFSQASTIAFWTTLAANFVSVSTYGITATSQAGLRGATAAAASNADLTAAHIQSTSGFIGTLIYETD